MLNTSGPSAHSVYIHIPFCRKRCSYCDFNTYAGIESLLPAYVNALCQEIVKVTSAKSSRYPVHTVFLGGGTPSLLTPHQLENILRTIFDCFDLTEDAEISMEANPGTIIDDRLREYHNLGVNRLSFGIQSSRADELKLLARIHTHEETINTINTARKAGFDNLNLDLIYNLPGQTMQHWQENLQAALSLAPEHLSLYALSIEEGTLLYRQMEEDIYPYPEDDLAADMMQEAILLLNEAGYIHYEISNWAKPGYECLHNKQYWKNQPYFGFGAGAHGLVDNVRTVNELNPRKYIDRCLQEDICNFPVGPTAIEHHLRNREEQIEDHMIMNFRLLQEGVNLAVFKQQFRTELESVYPDVIDLLLKSGHLEWCNNGNNIRIPQKHFFIANQILVNFIGERD